MEEPIERSLPMTDAVATANHGRLVLSRKKGEQIWIAPNIWITVHEIRGDKVRLMIEAPRDVQIVRDECLEPEDQYDAVLGQKSIAEVVAIP